MRRVLIVDDPRLAPRLIRLRRLLPAAWDLLAVPHDQVDFWNSPALQPLGAETASLADLRTTLPAGEAAALFVAATSPDALKLASMLAFRPGAHVEVLPHASQTADWIFSLYPLSEGEPPRVQGVHEHRADAAVHAFHDQLPNQRAARHLAVTCVVPQATLSEADIETWLLEDIDLLRQLAGEFKHLIAVAIPDAASGLHSVTVTLGGPEAGTVAWTLKPGPEFHWRLQADTGPELHRTADGEFRFAGSQTQNGPPPPPPFVPWENVLRAFDDLAALRRSLKRRRLVELQTETISERAQFKSLMSASGCGLLLVTLLGAVSLLGVGAALDPRDSLQRTSERLGLILRADDFQAGSSTLSAAADAEWPDMIRRLSQSSAPILVEQTDQAALDGQRRERVTARLTEAGVESPATRVELHRFRGDLFLTLLTLAWIALFLPLGIFLAVQGLLLAAPNASAPKRPAA